MLNLFVSYSHKDAEICKEMVGHMTTMVDDNLFSIFIDARIQPGDYWNQRISDELDKSDVILLMASKDFFESPYCKLETERALSLRETKKILVIPVMLRPCVVPERLNAIQAIHENKPVSLWTDKKRDLALTEAALKIRATVEAYSAITPRKRLARPDRKELTTLLHRLCDRVPQRDRLREALKPGIADLSRPFVIVVRGGSDDACLNFVERLQFELLPKFLMKSAQPLPAVVEWPEYEARRSPVELFEAGLSNCFNTGDSWPDVAAMNQSLRQCAAVNLLFCTVPVQNWGTHGAKLFDEYLTLWRKHWPKLPEGKQLIPVVSVAYGTDETVNQSVNDYLDSLSPGKNCVVLPALPAVVDIDLGNWLQHEKVRPFFGDGVADAVGKVDLIFSRAPHLRMKPLADIHSPRFINNL